MSNEIIMYNKKEVSVENIISFLICGINFLKVLRTYFKVEFSEFLWQFTLILGFLP